MNCNHKKVRNRVQADLILYAIVAAGLVFWLRSVLGTRHGDERERPNPFVAPAPDAANPNPVTAEETGILSLPTMQAALPRNVSIASDAVEMRLGEIASQEQSFDIVKFSQGAQDAFAIIVESFAAGDRETLKNLLAPNVYAAFESSLVQREKSGDTMSTEIHAVKKAEILDAQIKDRTAYVTIRFIAEETCVIRTMDGVILSGDPDRITEMNDIWVFSKPLRSRDPRWFLHETRDGDVAEDHKTPVPDMQ